MHVNVMMDVPNSSIPIAVAGSNVRVALAGKSQQLGDIAKAEGGSRVLLVSDAGIVAAGHVERAVRFLYHAGLAVRVFDGVEENPTTHHVFGDCESLWISSQTSSLGSAAAVRWIAARESIFF